ncbi:MAG TPA: ribonuclease III [Asticcacaulis sp.]|nr:ribonuclease III [Asticcacaulis sp.]
MTARIQNPRAKAVAALQARLGYSFQDKDLLELALTHASVAEGARRIADNERLEFLGDRVLGLMIAETLMETLPDASEGELSRRFHTLVSREACAAVAQELDLGPALRLAAGETKSGGRSNPTILGDAVEALMAAVYVDGGYEAAVRVFKPLWADAIRNSGNASQSNPKSFLQEWAVAHGKSPPGYHLIDRKGPDHAPVFTMEVRLDGFAPQTASGRSRQEAEKTAALRLIERENLSCQKN